MRSILDGMPSTNEYNHMLAVLYQVGALTPPWLAGSA
jgi:hypothetical protein